MRPRIAVLSVLVSISVASLIGVSPLDVNSEPELRSAIVFTSTRDGAIELYLMLTTPSGAPDPRQTFQLTQNTTAEGFAAFRRAASEACSTATG
jgi:hypothetical protein